MSHAILFSAAIVLALALGGGVARLVYAARMVCNPHTAERCEVTP